MFPDDCHCGTRDSQLSALVKHELGRQKVQTNTEVGRHSLTCHPSELFYLRNQSRCPSSEDFLRVPSALTKQKQLEEERVCFRL